MSKSIISERGSDGNATTFKNEQPFINTKVYRNTHVVSVIFILILMNKFDL